MNPNAYLEMANSETRHWWFIGRRVILTQIIHTLHMPPNAKILEIGSGTGGNLEMLASFGKVSALEMDASARAIASERTRNRFDIRLGSCPSDLPFIAERFDLICLFDVLEHIDDDLGTLTALKGLVAEGGRVLVTVPAHPWLWSVHDEFLHHKRRYSYGALRQKVSDSGFTPTRISYFNTVLFPLAVMMRWKDKLLDSSAASGTQVPFEPINKIFSYLFGLERFLLRKNNLPLGVSLLCVLHLPSST
ncbi:Methyltransferase family protein [Gammaproteobacteria bacterium]